MKWRNYKRFARNPGEFSHKYECWAYNHGFVLEHRLVAEQKYGRKLTSSDIVHHIDGNKTNNNPENIVVLTRSEHAKLHNGLKKCNKRRNTSA